MNPLESSNAPQALVDAAAIRLPPPPPPAPAPVDSVHPTPESVRPTFGDLPPSLEAIVAIAEARDFSDVHIGVGETPRYRDQGVMVNTGWPATDREQFRLWLEEIIEPADLDRFRRDLDFDGAYAFPFARVRINLLESVRGPAMVLRLIPLEAPTLDQLAMPPVMKQLANYPKGLVLMTGPTGCGKSTTLAAMIDWINRTAAKHVITIEDPVEFVHTSRTCLIRQREVGHHTKHFHTALRAALREDPDVILIGEIRDRDTLTTALEAAQTGHLVFGTLHTNSAVRTVDRVMGLFDPASKEQMRRELAESLLAVISQGLIRTVDGKRRAYHDLLVNTEACRDYIQRGDLDEVEQIMARSAFDGMQTINQSLAALVEEGQVDPREALSHSLKPNELAQTLRGRIS
ncbi:type IV pilus twitching motility protein PilT [Synechococcus sp. Cruz-9H2]|uniref:type IV pilus twitching motility protein PilT n=1 Tax=unclassified Synechococcus TaxID=2626047 RepID=UPI0020CBE129|nr:MULTISPECIES: type IV pilus twitching motility protein PilT [unclassified Synechococcus]MCP9818679.1 type IV pilus twitching motility protein PilT [Synechococcus sp. Cruz-9H2]MCP9842909.1 type IV pilus twitching motility protein PilT [Synechococcus sp. Edmonson 11F2]MCP9855934.1 type IV pilus twitching motility protein PilT [Synechococcus sp. Cruz-9C9]MCP9862179.1 type IV pilus twitching motility protein PilT [Synechococcus sp. Cruz-7E5]MCP9869450.1 type IV pilus twitching motility protein 